MGKLKNIVADVTFTLKASGITQVKAGRGTKDVEFYEYHGDVEGRLAASHVINAFTTAGLERGDKTFDAAISTLKI